MVQVDRLEADVLADEVLELAGRDFAQALESRDLVADAQFPDGRLLLLLGVAVQRPLLVADAEQGVSRMKRWLLRMTSGKN